MCPTHKWQIGFAVRYDSSDLDGNDPLVLEEGIGGRDLNFDSTRVIFYTHYNFNNPLYLNAFVSYAFNQYFEYQNLGASLREEYLGIMTLNNGVGKLL